MHSGVENVFSDNLFNLIQKKKLLKGGESQNQAVYLVGYVLVLLLFTWGLLASLLTYLQRILLKVLHGVALVNYNEHDTIV